MRINNIILKGVLFITAIIAGFGFTSCNDDPDKYEVAKGTPTVLYVRTPYLSQRDSLITEATTGMSICLVGQNLRSITELYFNDLKAILNTSYITDNTLLVDVPKSIPSVVSDKIYMITASKDTVTYDFHISVPTPTLSALSNEYAPAGSTVSITGNYFIDDPNVPLEVELPDGQKVMNFKSISQSAISFVMPECTTEGPLTVKTIYGTTESTFHYLDTRGMLFDFDGVTGLGNHGWHDRTITSDETSITGKFVQLGDGNTELDASGGWNDSQFAFEYWCGSWDNPQNITSGDGIALYNLADFTNPDKKALKFEMYIPKTNPWMSGAMQICFEGVDKVTYSGNPIAGASKVVSGNAYAFNGEDEALGNWGRALYRPWTSTGSYDTGDEWVTVTIPLSDFKYNRIGGTAISVPSSVEDFASLTIFVVGGGISGTSCYPLIKLDNIRVVPN